MDHAETRTRPRPEATELTLLAPIRRGFIEGVDGRTYLGRLQVLLRTLNAAVLSAPEISLMQHAEHGGSVHSLQFTILEPEHKLLLSVGFARGQGPCLPALWREFGALLDLIFCNCKSYVPAHDQRFEDYAEWMRCAQADAAFFFNALPVTVADEGFLREMERLQRGHIGPAGTDVNSLWLRVPGPVVVARQRATSHPQERVRQGLQALAVLHRLIDLYPRAGPDGALLWRATQELLHDLRADAIRPLYAPATATFDQFAAPIRWFEHAPPPEPMQSRGVLFRPG